MAFDVSKLSRLMLGKQGENNATVIDIDVSDWLARWPSASIQVLHQRHDEDTPYPVSVSLTGGYVTWVVTSADTGIPGRGYAEVRAVEGEVLKKSRVIETMVEPSIPGTAGNPPEAVADWTQKLEQAVKTVQDKLDSGELVGNGLQILGYFPDEASLTAAVTLPEAGDAYGVGTGEPFDIYVWDALNGVWVNNGAIQGPAGPKGDQGETGAAGRDGVFVRNLLDNSDFRNPVNQRGKNSYTGDGAYTIDRWVIMGDATIAVNSGSITIGSASGDGRVGQIIPQQYVKDGYTAFALRTDGTLVSLTVWGNESGHIVVAVPPGEYLWAALYVGEYTAETLPEYIPKGYAAELMECQRYYQQYSVVGLTCRNNGYATTLLPVTMRVAPTISVGARRLYTTSYEDVSGAYPNTLGANTTSIFFNNSFYEGFVTITCNDVSLSADL